VEFANLPGSQEAGLSQTSGGDEEVAAPAEGLQHIGDGGMETDAPNHRRLGKRGAPIATRRGRGYCVMVQTAPAGMATRMASNRSNSLAEMYTMTRYLGPEMLSERKVDHFDSWAANFAEAVTSLELAPDGSGYRMHTRFAKFINLPELLSMFRTVADV
jgi:hypothetical protein